MNGKTYHIDQRDELGGWEPVSGLFPFRRLGAARKEFKLLVSRTRTPGAVYRLRARQERTGEEEVLTESRPWAPLKPAKKDAAKSEAVERERERERERELRRE